MTSLAEELRALARRHGVSRDSIISGAYDPAVRGTSSTFIRKVLAGDRRPNRAMLESMAAVVGERPEVFSAYLLMTAREMLDESVVGLDAALTNLAKVCGPLGLGEATSRDGDDLLAAARDLDADDQQHGDGEQQSA